jgi:hypothetical protein
VIESPEHRPSMSCWCSNCCAFYRRGAYKTPSMLDRMRAENRPHLRDPAFLKFMGKVVGDTLKKS